MLPVWPLVCTARGCHNATYPKVATLFEAYAFAAEHRWTVVVSGDEHADVLLCPRCSLYPPSTYRRMETTCPPSNPAP